MTKQHDIARVWDIVEKTHFGMLTTHFRKGDVPPLVPDAGDSLQGGLRARPMDARPNRDSGNIFFLTDNRGHKDDEIDAAHDVGLVFINASDKAYLSITARAEILNDRAKIEEIWQKSDSAWWPDGASDPNIRVLRVTPSLAELWDGPSSSVVAAFEFAKAKVTGEKPLVGENIKKTVPM